MVNKRIIIIVVVAVAVVAAAAGFVQGRRVQAPAEQNTAVPSQSDEQISKDKEGASFVEPDINNQEFKLTGSNVNCSTSTVNGVTASSCTGNIRVIPRAQSDMEPGLYKINEQTKLISKGVSQDLNSLQQLSQNQTVVRLKLAAGSSDTLAEISY